VTLAMLWRVWIRSADHRALDAIVVPVYLMPALTLVLAVGLAAESKSARRSFLLAGASNTSLTGPRLAPAVLSGPADPGGSAMAHASCPRT